MDRTDERPAEIRQAIDVIEAARQRSRTSIRAAAADVGISEGWWRAIVRGYIPQHGTEAPAVPSIKTLLAMSRTVGVEAEVREVLGEEPPEDSHKPDFKYTPPEDLFALIRDLASRVPEEDEVLYRISQAMLAVADERDAAERERDAG